MQPQLAVTQHQVHGFDCGNQATSGKASLHIHPARTKAYGAGMQPQLAVDTSAYTFTLIWPHPLSATHFAPPSVLLMITNNLNY
jgi:hypothetical protein